MIDFLILMCMIVLIGGTSRIWYPALKSVVDARVARVTTAAAEVPIAEQRRMELASLLHREEVAKQKARVIVAEAGEEMIAMRATAALQSGDVKALPSTRDIADEDGQGYINSRGSIPTLPVPIPIRKVDLTEMSPVFRTRDWRTAHPGLLEMVNSDIRAKGGTPPGPNPVEGVVESSVAADAIDDPFPYRQGQSTEWIGHGVPG